jgi:hypothetical protein
MKRTRYPRRKVWEAPETKSVGTGHGAQSRRWWKWAGRWWKSGPPTAEPGIGVCFREAAS